MKAQIRRWSTEENVNYFVDVDVIAGSNGLVMVMMDNVVITDGYSTVEDALSAAEKIIRNRKLSNS